MLNESKIFVLEWRMFNYFLCWFFNYSACRFWLWNLHLFNRFWVRRHFRITYWQSIGKQFQYPCWSQSLDRLNLRLGRFIFDITDMNIIFWYFLMFLFIFPPSVNPLINLFNPLGNSILMMARIDRFMPSFVFDTKAIKLFLDIPRLIFLIHLLNIVYFFKADVLVFLVKIKLFFVIF